MPEAYLLATRVQVEIARPLATVSNGAQFVTFPFKLAKYGAALTALGRHSEALPVIREPVERIRAFISENNPEPGQRLLLLAVDNYAKCLDHTGDHVQALQACEEAVTIARKLAEKLEGHNVDTLHMYLVGYSNLLDAAGHHEESITVTREGVAIARTMVRIDSSRRGNLGGSLWNLSARLRSAGFFEESVATSEEAIEIFREARHESGGGFEWGLYSTLVCYADSLDEVCRYNDSLKAGQEAIALQDSFGPDHSVERSASFAYLLAAHGGRLAKIGRLAEAARPLELGVGKLRRVNTLAPEGCAGRLASALVNYGMYLLDTEEIDKAIEAFEEAVALGTTIGSPPSPSDGVQAGSLDAYAIGLLRARRVMEAIPVQKEAVGLWRRAVASAPRLYMSHFAKSLRMFSLLLSVAGRMTDSLSLAEEAYLASLAAVEANPSRRQLVTDSKLWLDSLHRRIGFGGDPGVMTVG